MAKRGGFAATVMQAQREFERAQVAQRRNQQAAVRQADRARRAHEKALLEANRAQAQDEKERKRLYLVARAAEVEAMNADLELTIDGLGSLLQATLQVDDYLDLERLKQRPRLPPFDPGPLANPELAPQWPQFAPPEPTGLGKMLGRSKYEQAVAEARLRFDQEAWQHGQRDQQRLAQLAENQRRYDQAVAERKRQAEAFNATIDEFRACFENDDPEAIREYFTLVLRASSYPTGFPVELAVAYVPDSRQLVVERELPGIEIIPKARQYKFVRTRDAITETARPAKDAKALYASVLTQIALRTLHELFEADRTKKIDTIVFNGFVSSVDRATGQPVRPTLITVRTTRDVFEPINLGEVDPAVCLQHLGAGVSKSPAELAPVRPILELNMVDRRFIDEDDVLTDLDQRPNLMELTPSEFESLITNLFSKMGLDTKLTQASRDGGVDCVAFDQRPIFGGKVVIQAKRYRHTVGVAAVRDLFGTVQNEGASKGILVTTSGYGAASFAFANNKPLELLDGANLLFLLEEHAGITAKIVPPVDWKDPDYSAL